MILLRRPTLPMFALLMVLAMPDDARCQTFLGIFSDQAYSSCVLSDGGPPAATEFYIVLKQTAPSTAVKYQLEFSLNFACAFISEASPYNSIIGDTRGGVFVSFGACLGGDVLVHTIYAFCTGITEPCAFAHVVAHPDSPSGKIEMTDCSSQVELINGNALYVNPDGSCPCGSVPNPIQPSSWGAIKALYR